MDTAGLQTLTKVPKFLILTRFHEILSKCKLLRNDYIVKSFLNYGTEVPPSPSYSSKTFACISNVFFSILTIVR